jgi:hypothetical protein
LYFKKQIVFIFLVLTLFAGIFSAAASGFETSLTIESDTGGLHNTLYLPVIVADPELIAGAAFTIKYSNALQVDVSTGFFSFKEQKQEIGSDETLLMIAAAREKDNDTLSSGPNIMTLRVKLKEDGEPGSYEIKMIPSVIDNTEFGYPAESDPVEDRTLDLLIGHECQSLAGTFLPDEVVTKAEAKFDSSIKAGSPVPAIMLLLAL